MPRHRYRRFAYTTPPELQGGEASGAPVVIVGAGPIGLTAAIDLASHGLPSVVLDDNDVVSVGSRAICWAKRTLEIFDRLGVGDRMVEKGVTWKVGRLFRGDQEIYSFDLLPEDGHKMPAFVNLQQYHVEEYLIERCLDFPGLIDLRFKNRVAGLEQREGAVRVKVETPDGPYTLEAGYLLACDGAKSAVRGMMGLELVGEAFEERFLIADVEMKADFPSERWFWFEPTFHPGQSALLHKQPDDIYRIDLQLGPDADPELEKRPERVVPRIDKVVGGRPFELDWVSVYSFRCQRLERFVHGRVIFAGDSAHVVSPFGARGGNGGIQDVDNLCWKLAAVIKGEAVPALLETYNTERVFAADENIRNSSRSTRFMSPAEGAERLFRDAALDLARDHAFARLLVNSGRLSRPCSLAGLPGVEADDPGLSGQARPGESCPDAPLPGGGWLLNRLDPMGFTILGVGVEPPEVAGTSRLALPAEGRLAERYGAGVYLIRPDQHVAARWRQADAQKVEAALRRALRVEPARAAA